MNAVAQLMRNFSIRSRMQAAVVLVLALFALVGLVGTGGGLKIKSLNQTFMEHSVKELDALAAVRHRLAQVRLFEKQMVIDYEDGVAVLKHREAWTSGIEATRKALEALNAGAGQQTRSVVKDSQDKLQSYVKGSETILGNIQNGSYDNARVADRMLAKARADVVGVEGNVDQLEKLVHAAVGQAQVHFNQVMKQVMWAFGAAIALVALVLTPLTLIASRSIVEPLRQASEVTQAIAAGNLANPIAVQGRDEVAQLLGNLSNMQDKLRQMVSQVHESSQSIGHASAEVASGNVYLSQRTEQAAGSLQQTASSMEQLTSTVAHSADSARQANEMAAQAAQVAQRGGAVVAQVVSTMNEINHSAKKIADIIGTIDGIAFQTNILALNAAVEAARAGEQGRGFAVVASEVRSLAQRSAAAAREIKSLIGASVERVDAGSRLVADAGSTMNDIVASVQRVSDIISAISSAAIEQSAGIGQVNTAVSELDGMTQQNAALVEQSAAAAESLRQQAQRLGTLVGSFRLSPGAA